MTFHLCKGKITSCFLKYEIMTDRHLDQKGDGQATETEWSKLSESELLSQAVELQRKAVRALFRRLVYAEDNQVAVSFPGVEGDFQDDQVSKILFATIAGEGAVTELSTGESFPFERPAATNSMISKMRKLQDNPETQCYRRRDSKLVFVREFQNGAITALSPESIFWSPAKSSDIVGEAVWLWKYAMRMKTVWTEVPNRCLEEAEVKDS